MGKMLSTAFALLVLFAFIGAGSRAQWPNDPEANMMIADEFGEENVPHVANSPDGGCYISWYANVYDTIAGFSYYHMMLQRFDSEGNAMWGEGGVVVSGHPQNTWITDYDLTADRTNNAILVFNDIRVDSIDTDIYAYKISPSGEFLWGPDGLTISDNTNDEFMVKTAFTTDNNIVFCWEEIVGESVTIDLRKVNRSGQDVWDPPVVTFVSPQYSLSIPRVIQSDNGGVIFQAQVQIDPYYGALKTLYAFKVDAEGNKVWGDTGVAIVSVPAYQMHQTPNLISDGDGGGFSFGYDSRTNQHHVYVQHINADGTMAWPADGVAVTDSIDQMEMAPDLAYFPETGNVMVFYQVSDYDQTVIGIGGQMFDSQGNRMWGNSGQIFVYMDTGMRGLIHAARQGSDAVVAYLDAPVGVYDAEYVDAIKVDPNGDMVWPNSPIQLSSWYCERLFLDAEINGAGQYVAVWSDKRNDTSGDIFVQNINPDGSFGPYEPQAVDDEALPRKFTLKQNYPNPFNAETAIEYVLPRSSQVAVEVFDLAGRRVEVIAEGMESAGPHRVVWDAEGVPSGVYFYRVKCDGHSQSRRMTLLK